MHYPEIHEQDMISFYKSLSEKDKRRYAAVEANKIGHGGIDYICCLFGCDYKTVKKGTFDLKNEESLNQSRIRAAGSGRAKLIDTIDGINEAFLDVLKDSTAGDPMNDKVKWTSLDKTEIAKALKKKAFQ